MLGGVGVDVTYAGYGGSGIGISVSNKEISGMGLAAMSGERNSIGKTMEGEKNKGINGIEECETCKNRKYQDGSDDPGVSFKSPTNLSPSEAATAVYSHEREHYTREEAKAKEEGKEVLSNNIKIFTAVCPECGKVYVSGGETTTVTRKKAESASFAKEFFDRTVGMYLPKEMDVTA